MQIRKSFGYIDDHLETNCTTKKLDLKMKFNTSHIIPKNFKIMTYNIWGLIRGKGDHLDFVKDTMVLRMEKISEIILEDDPDIVCLQEMTNISYEYLSKLKSRYKYCLEPNLNTNINKKERNRDVEVFVYSKYCPKQMKIYSITGNLGYNNISTNTYSYPINISILDPASAGSYFVNNWFSQLTPPVTPTPTTTWADTAPIPAGYIRTWFNAVDGTAGSVIYGAALNLKDVQNGSWKNNTAGYSYIDTLPSHTINAYATMTGYSGDTRLGLPAADTVYELTLWSGLLAPGSGNVNLLVIVTDATTGYTLDRVSLTATAPSGAQTGGMTGSAGTETFVVPNMSFITVSGSKAGYRSATGTITTTAFGPDTLRIPLSKLTVTPTITATPLPGQPTVAPTIDANDPSRNGGDTSPKAQEMMNWLAMNGMDLVQLCFLVTVLALLGVKLGK